MILWYSMNAGFRSNPAKALNPNSSNKDLLVCLMLYLVKPKVKTGMSYKTYT